MIDLDLCGVLGGAIALFYTSNYVGLRTVTSSPASQFDCDTFASMLGAAML